MNNSVKQKPINGLVYGGGSVIRATIKRGDDDCYQYLVKEDECLSLFDYDSHKLARELFEERYTISLGNGKENTAFCEAVYNFKIPKNGEKDLKGLCYNEKKEKINRVPHINIWYTDEFYAPDRYCSGWVFVELPHEIDGVKYVPIIIHNHGNGVSVHPDYHKYFLRAFNKQDRHLILGYCMLHADYTINQIRFATDDRKEATEDDLYYGIKAAIEYKDSDATKRINQGPKYSGYTTFEPLKNSIADYERYLNNLKSCRK